MLSVFRFDLIVEEAGRVCICYDLSDVRLSMQGDGCTLKLLHARNLVLTSEHPTASDAAMAQPCSGRSAAS